MAKVTFKRGPSTALNTVPIVDGQITVTIDTGEMYVDVPDDGGQIVRKKITDTSLENLHFEVVEELPEVGEGNVIYLVPKSIIGEENTYDEYIYSNGQWELIGDTEIDLSDYAKKNGYYPDLFAGGADQLISTTVKADAVPYAFRPSGGSLSVNEALKLKKVIGGSVIWNQLAKPYTANNYQQVDCTATFGDDNSAIMTASAMYGHIQATCSIPNGHIALIFTEIKTLQYSGNIVLRISAEGGSSQIYDYAGSNEWKYVGGIEKMAYNITHIGIWDNRSSNRNAIYLRNIQVFDLTQMFGKTIAEYIKSLGFTNGLAWFRALFPDTSYPYSTYVKKSVQTSGHKTVGFNIYDYTSNNNPQVLGGYQYQITGTYTGINFYPIRKTTAEIITPNANGYFTPRVNGRLEIAGAQSNVCVHLTWDGERDGEFEAYQGYVHGLDSEITLNGVPILDSDNKLRYIGDEYTPDGRIKRNIIVIDLSNLNWQYSNGGVRDWHVNIDGSFFAESVSAGYFLSEKYYSLTVTDYNNNAYSGFQRICWSYNGVLRVYNGSSTTPPSGYMIAELATPTWDTAEPYQEIQIVSNWGTEQFIPATTADVFVPVGHVSEYTIDLKAKLESSPDSPNNDGTYILKRESGANAYISFNPFEYAKINGEYPDMRVGEAATADQIKSTNNINDYRVYNYRTVADRYDVGNRKYEKAIMGMDIAWNQLCNPEDYEADKIVDQVSFTKQSDGGVLISVGEDEHERPNLYTAENCTINSRFKTNYTQTSKAGTYITDFMPADCSNGIVRIELDGILHPWVKSGSEFTQEYPYIERIAFYSTNDDSGYIYENDVYGTSYVHGNPNTGGSSSDISGTTKFEWDNGSFTIYLGSRYDKNNPNATLPYIDSIRYFRLEINMGTTALTQEDILSTDDLGIYAYSTIGYKLSAPNIFIPNHIYLLSIAPQEMYDSIEGITPCITNSTFTASGFGDYLKKAIIWNADDNVGNLFAIELYDDCAEGNYLIYPQIYDLTLMFGTYVSTGLVSLGIPNRWYQEYNEFYDYSIEESAIYYGEPALLYGYYSFKKYFPKTYYPYNAGELKCVQTPGIETVGFNQYDPNTETADILSWYDLYNPFNALYQAEEYIPNRYQITGDYTSIIFIDIDGNTYENYDQNYIDNEGYFYPPIRRGVLQVIGGNPETTCIHLTWSGYRDYEFAPYAKKNYALDNNLSLHGIPLDYYGQIKADGDIYTSDGTVTRKYATYNLGSASWSKQTIPDTDIVIFIAPPPNPTPASKAQLLCAKYIRTSDGAYSIDIEDQTIYIDGNNGIGIRDDSKASLSTTEFKTAMSDVYVVYERQGAPVTESADPYAEAMEINDYGTERFLSPVNTPVEVPVGHNTEYLQNLRDKLQNLPEPEEYEQLAGEVGDIIDEFNETIYPFFEETLPELEQTIATSAKDIRKIGTIELDSPMMPDTSYDLQDVQSADLVLNVPTYGDCLDENDNDLLRPMSEIYVCFYDANSLTINWPDPHGYVDETNIESEYTDGNLCELHFKLVAGIWVLMAKQYPFPTQPE